MFLKKLEIKGFKSFAEEFSIEFVPGINAVVGPNGSGKSNISDAIRWVLGEQSARSLRGAKMEDIIFAGSDTRRALSRAEVTLVLHNEEGELPLEYSEVSVSRKLYRNGDSEYLINRQPCRRKDIVELFMDSGIGKSAFSIIGQGQVEEVLSSKPEERRLIFEEAAGVVKYKQRKQQAERKLSETKDNLQRVEDILFELEGQLEPLKVQASLAKDYLDKKEELEDIEIALLGWEIREKHQLWSALEKEIKELEEEKTVTEKKVQAEEQKRQKVQQSVEELDKKISSLQDDLVSTSEQLEKSEGRRRLLEERGKNADEKKEEWAERLEALQKQYEKTTAKLRFQKQKEEESMKHLSDLKEKLDDVRRLHQLYAQSSREDIEHLKSEYIERLNEQAAIRNEDRYLSDQKEQLERKISVLHEENNQFIHESTQAEETFAKWKIHKEEAQKAYEDSKKSTQHWQEKWKRIDQETKNKENKLYEAYRYVDQTKSRIQLLEEMEATYAGFYQGVKEVLKARGNHLTGIAGAVAELIHVPKEFITAVETALGGALQHVVVSSEADARKAIQFLRVKRKGRATFLPADVIRPRWISENVKRKLRQTDGFVTFGADAVSVPKEYQHITEHLLGQVVLAESLEAANRLAKVSNYSVRIVTLEGDIVSPGGSMTGGASNQKKGQVLGRQQELEELKDKYDYMMQTTEKLEDTVRQLKQEYTEASQEMERWREEEERTRVHLEKMKENLSKSEAELSQSQSRLSLFHRESSSLEEEKRRLHNRQHVISENMETIQQKIEQIESQIAQLETKEKERAGKEEELKERETALKVEIAAAREAASYDKTERERLQNQASAERNQVTALQHELEQLEQEMIAGDEDRLEDKISSLKEKKIDLTNTINQLREERVTDFEEAERLKVVLQQLSVTYQQQQELCQEKQVSLNRTEVELDNRLQELQESYEISYERAVKEYPLAIDPKEAAKQIKLIKKGIEELGAVNLGAIDEYERIYERATFLQNQRSDLLEAESSLYEVIDEMDTEMKRRFSETFQSIRTHFQETFTTLFEGGEADLYLTDPDNILESGVDISARPPGKKKQHLSLLSGGEKALTAIALLFSIVKAKPVPFCVLDEVEAALDEANLLRFSAYLRSFSKTTQFIVISHRKTTMEEADVLYGITMEESGVSKMVSVKLEETEQLLEPQK
ncbi:chromosome segregation protein SMC [Alteribacillus iranensis]|uniref:Chromosome partition protein Smc n=1 Tax=Alteribacillus iranensis TaxID=930128 RepID=A0A1I2A733_9BACI|nr:chromosome segregation protein SMC [Alteribacillus iranensis]SFE39646.1 condensin subunit Smc [Alteribacillus iranensis]